MLEPSDLVVIKSRVPSKYLTLLETFDKENQSNAVRLALDKLFNWQQQEFLQKYLILFAFGLVLIALAPLMALLIIEIILYIAGIFYIGYSTTTIVRWKLKK